MVLLKMYDGHFLRYGREKNWGFMDDFSIVGASFDDCLANMGLVLKICEKTNLVLN